MLVGHKKQWEYLNNLAAAQKVPHALLFAGQEQLGKKTIALEFTKLLNCQGKNGVTSAGKMGSLLFSVENRGDPDFSRSNPIFACQKCQTCSGIKKNIYPDFRIIQPHENKEIKIAQIRELEQFLSMRPFVGACKIAIIDDCDLMTRESQSCILKTLEEPKGNSFLILITARPDSLLPTIISRIERINFYPVSSNEIKTYLGLKQAPANRADPPSLKLQRARAEDIIKLSFNRPGKAIDFLENPEKLKDEINLFQKIAALSSQDYTDRFGYAKELAETSSIQLKQTLELWLRYFRAQLTNQPEGRPRDKAQAVNIIKAIEKTLFLIHTTNINKKLALEVLMLEL